MRDYSKLFKNVCQKAKALHIKRLLKDSNNKIKRTWTISNKETGRTKVCGNEYSLNINNKTVTSDEEIATAFDMFLQLFQYTIQSLNSSSSGAKSMIRANFSICIVNFVFYCIDYAEVIKTFKHLDV